MFKTIRVNTKTKAVVSEEFKKVYGVFGNRGLIAKVMNEEVEPTCDPLGAENKLIIALGAFAGTTLPTAHRLSVGGKSPLTGGIKEANVGGNVGYMLAQHGIKMIIFEDIPADDNWYILKVNKDSEPQLIPANDLIGLNNYPLIESLHNKFGKDIAVLSIGVAGERQYKNSTLQATDMGLGHPSRSAARGGMGAVAGSKKIKAIVVEKPNNRYEMVYADKEKYMAAQKKFVGALINPGNKFVQGLTKVGTIGTMDKTGPEAMMPVKNFSGEFFGNDKFNRINSKAFLQKIEERDAKTGLARLTG
ncbi:MAG: aldehyde ferredoxin oxidoreductase N-terminal domain-containing protein [Bacillota bacterium]|nr:aldehyde ferredoxin oxidoreductase N-terminal domain-containing protein [Bacillota bacterium]